MLVCSYYDTSRIGTFGWMFKKAFFAIFFRPSQHLHFLNNITIIRIFDHLAFHYSLLFNQVSKIFCSFFSPTSSPCLTILSKLTSKPPWPH